MNNYLYIFEDGSFAFGTYPAPEDLDSVAGGGLSIVEVVDKTKYDADTKSWTKVKEL